MLTDQQAEMRKQFVLPMEKALAKAGATSVKTTWIQNIAETVAEFPGRSRRVRIIITDEEVEG